VAKRSEPSEKQGKVGTAHQRQGKADSAHPTADAQPGLEAHPRAKTRELAVTDAQEQATSFGDIRDTIDSIIVAFILAFVFRAFLVEAFIIPTGSMAPTLYGEHGSVVCEDCGYPFVYGLTDPKMGAARYSRNAKAICPNCAHVNTNLYYNDNDHRTESGDRILVLKWLNDLGIDSLGPHRWDVVVFKDPKDGVTNFIKRMVGMPNEVLSIIAGDIYTVPIAKLSDQARSIMEAQVA